MTDNFNNHNEIISHSPYNSFVQYLDKVQLHKVMSYYDVMRLTRNIDMYYEAYKTTKQKPSTPPSPIHINPSSPRRLSLMTDDTTNELIGPSKTSSASSSASRSSTTPKRIVKKKKKRVSNEYDIWQLNHRMDVCPPLEEPKEHVDIICNLKNTDDILSLINEHPFDPTKTYNIDLQSLHKIRPELEDLQYMTGMQSLKKSIMKQLLYFIQGFSSNDKHPQNSDYKHTILTGPPGTGKTEIAKIMGKMYSKIGILKNNVFQKVTRSDLVAGYLGQTAMKTKKAVEDAIGGVLFIDEAYSLQPDDIFAKECIDTLCECMSFHKNDLMVIVAGYEKDLEESIFKINRGMRSRFLWDFSLHEYTPVELYSIFRTKIERQDKWELDVKQIDDQWFIDHKSNFQYNGRDMELLFTYVKIAHSHRVYGKPTNEKYAITKEDLNEGLEMLLQNRKTNDKQISTMYAMYT